MAEELAQAVDTINQDDTICAVLVTGSGGSFSSGWEVPALQRPHDIGVYQAARHLARIVQPVVAAIHGEASGQGLELALAADIRVGASDARFSMPQLRSGMLPWDGGIQRLVRTVGRAHATDLVLTGRTIDAQEAHRIGLVTRVVEAGELREAARETLKSVLTGAPRALQYAKETVIRGTDMALEQGLRLEADLNILLHSTYDRAEGIRSFMEKRPPVFRGE